MVTVPAPELNERIVVPAGMPEPLRSPRASMLAGTMTPVIVGLPFVTVPAKVPAS
jgi:hypothetical protein